MKHLFTTFFVPVLFFGGCSAPKKTVPPPVVSVRKKPLSPGMVKEKMRRSLLDIQTQESLRHLAGEPVKNTLRFALSEAIAEVAEPGYSAPAELDIRLNLLEQSISCAYLLAQNADADLEALQKVRCAELLDCSTDILLYRIAAGRKLLEILPRDTPEFQAAAEKLRDAELELTTQGGIPPEELREMAIILPAVQMPALPLRAWIMKHLPRRREYAGSKLNEAFFDRINAQYSRREGCLQIALDLLRTPAPDLRDGALIFQLQLDFMHAGKAFDAYLLAKEKAELENSAANRASLIRAECAWRVAMRLLLRDSSLSF